MDYQEKSNLFEDRMKQENQFNTECITLCNFGWTVRGIMIDSEINDGTAALVQIPCLDDPKRMKEMIVKKTNIKLC